jgi:DNA-binding NarL/FixJ family response regulator
MSKDLTQGRTFARPPATVWLVDDNQSLREIIQNVIEEDSPLRCSRQFGDPEELLAALAERPAPEVILLDIHMGRFNGLDAVAPIRRAAPRTRIIMLTTFHDSLAKARAFRDGAAGFHLKSDSTEEIIEGIYRALARPLPEPPAMETEVLVARQRPLAVPRRQSSSPRATRAPGFRWGSRRRALMRSLKSLFFKPVRSA